MMKHYKKFYEIDNNRYYTIVADDETYIASESFLKVGKANIFGTQKEIVTGFKLLKFSPSIAQLFNSLVNLETSKKQRYASDDLTIYNHIDNKELKESIKQAYLQVINDEMSNLLQEKTELELKDEKELAKTYDKYIERLKYIDPMDGIDIKTPEHTSCMIIKTMLREGIEHLYTERVNAFTKNVYLYEQDDFGNLTIYRLITIKNVVKTIDTFIYDKKLVESLFETLYKEGR